MRADLLFYCETCRFVRVGYREREVGEGGREADYEGQGLGVVLRGSGRSGHGGMWWRMTREVRDSLDWGRGLMLLHA